MLKNRILSLLRGLRFVLYFLNRLGFRVNSAPIAVLKCPAVSLDCEIGKVEPILIWQALHHAEGVS